MVQYIINSLDRLLILNSIVACTLQSSLCNLCRLNILYVVYVDFTVPKQSIYSVQSLISLCTPNSLYVVYIDLLVSMHSK